MSKEQDGKPATSDPADKADKTDKGAKVDRSVKAAKVDKAAKRGRGKGVAPTAAEISAMRVVLAPVVSEKSTLMGEKNNQVAFRVTGDATKTQVRAAIEAFFKVDVAAVNMVNVKGKIRRSGRSSGRRQDVRKAYVTLAPGQEINFAESR